MIKIINKEIFEELSELLRMRYVFPPFLCKIVKDYLVYDNDINFIDIYLQITGDEFIGGSLFISLSRNLIFSDGFLPENYTLYIRDILLDESEWNIPKDTKVFDKEKFEYNYFYMSTNYLMSCLESGTYGILLGNELETDLNKLGKSIMVNSDILSTSSCINIQISSDSNVINFLSINLKTNNIHKGSSFRTCSCKISYTYVDCNEDLKEYIELTDLSMLLIKPLIRQILKDE